ncbi:MAG: hypothetical protein ACRDH9_00355 [Actinomycetota bacterium]
MKRFTVIAAMLVVGLTAQASLAASPHFVKASASRQGNSLVVSFKEAGLGNNQTVTIEARADFTRTDSCVNGGGKVPSDPKKTVTQGTTSKSGNFTSDKNGNINGSLSLTTSTTLKCPPGQKATLLSLSFTNVRVSDLTNGVTRSISGSF